MTSPRVWNPKETFNLIRLWKAYPCLWMKESKDYRNKAKKEAALRKISSTLGIDTPEIVRKSHNLRCGMNTELRKARSKAEKGLLYQSPWAYYRALMFIADEIPVPQNVQSMTTSQDSGGSGEFEDKTTDWPTIVARYGSVELESNPDAVFPQPMDLNGGLFESLTDPHAIQYYQADYGNGQLNDDDLIEEEHGLPIETCAAEMQSNPSVGPSDEDSVQSVASEKNPKSDPPDLHPIKAYVPKPRKKPHNPETIPYVNEYPIFGDFVCSEMRQMRSTDLRNHLKTMIQRVITDTSREDDLEYSLSTSGKSNGGLPERIPFEASALESNDDQQPFGQFVAMRLKEIRCDERRKRLKRTIQRFMLDIAEEDDMEYTIDDTDHQVKAEPE